MSGSPADRGVRIYGLLLRLYPRAFRQRYGVRLLAAFRMQRSEHRAKGGSAAAFWVSILVDAAGSAVRLHAAGLSGRLRRPAASVSRSGRRKDPVLATILSDVAYAWRGLRRNPTFGVASLATITLAIAAGTAVFSVVDVALIRPLALEEPERLVHVAEVHPEQVGGGAAAPETFNDWVRGTTAFDGFAASAFNSRVYTEGGRAEVLTVVDVNAAYFEVLGRGAQAGRVFGARDVERGEWLAVMGDAFWRSRFGADPGVIGRTLSLDGRSYTVVGVMPRDFAIPDGDVPLWTLEDWSDDTGRGGRYLAVIGRLAAGRSVAQAEAELDAIAARLAESFPSTNRGWDVAITPLREALIGPAAAPLRLIGVSVALLLLVASFNVASLMLARSAARRREIAVRQALGGGWRIARLLIAESALIAGLGGFLGVALANGLVRALVASPPVEIPLIEAVSVDGRALLFALAAVLMTGVVFGLVPAWRASRTAVQGVDMLRTAGASAGGRGSAVARARSALVIGEIAVAVTLVIGAALLLRTLVALRAVDPGFEVEDRVAARVFLDGAAYSDPAQRNAWVRRVEAATAALPGVRAVGTINVLPMDPISVNIDLPYATRSTAGVPSADLPQAELRVASGDIFDAMGVDVVRGRGFRETDDEDGVGVVVVNETLATQAFGGADPIGEQIAIHWAAGATYEVIGVVRDTRNTGLTTEPAPQMYVHFPQLSLPFGATSIVVALEGGATAMVRAVEEAVLAADPGQPAHSVITLESLVADSIARERFASTLLAGLALLSLVLAALGLYSLVAFVARQRSRDLAIRMALGARRADAIGGVMRQSLRLAVVGALIGLGAASGGARLVEGLLFRVSPVDPLIYVLAPAGLIALALLAAAKPAWTAANTNPAAVLRQE